MNTIISLAPFLIPSLFIAAVLYLRKLARTESDSVIHELPQSSPASSSAEIEQYARDMMEHGRRVHTLEQLYANRTGQRIKSTWGNWVYPQIDLDAAAEASRQTVGGDDERKA